MTGMQGLVGSPHPARVCSFSAAMAVVSEACRFFFVKMLFGQFEHHWAE
jgi:hypothetical protein